MKSTTTVTYINSVTGLLTKDTIDANTRDEIIQQIKSLPVAVVITCATEYDAEEINAEIFYTEDCENEEIEIVATVGNLDTE